MPNLFNEEYLFFWGHTQKEEIDRSCLSQWYPSCFVIDDTMYLTAEHYMMVQKALLFNDKETIIKILETNSPKEAKRLGRLVKNYDNDTWHRISLDVVIKGNIAKFQQNNKLGDFLKSTGDKIIVEASPYDKVWGIGMSMNDPDILDESKWRGKNLLGKALMKARESL